MKKIYLFPILLSFLVMLSACSDDSSTDAPASLITGSWEINSSTSTGGELVKMIEASFTLVETNGALTGNAEITYINKEGPNDVEMILNDSVTGTFDEASSPHISLNVGGGAFIYTGNWVNSGVNFTGDVNISFNQEIFSESEVFLFKADN